MIRLIAAIDSKRGMADDHGIPWQGKLPTDVTHFRAKTIHSDVLMGWVTYTEFPVPLSDRQNFVFNSRGSDIRQGFTSVEDLEGLISKYHNNPSAELWIIGGAGLFAQTAQYADELHITQLQADFKCTKFFPEFKDTFELTSRTEPQTENGITFHFEIWKRKLK